LALGDTLHVIYSNIRGGEKISYVRSTDRGDTWSSHQVLSDTINTELSQTPRIMISYGNRLLATWASYNYAGVYHYNIAYVSSLDGGFTWTSPQYIFQYNLEYPITHTAANEGDMVNIIMGNWTGDSVGIYNIRSINFGQTWLPRQLIFSIVGSGRRDCAAADNFVHLAWSGR
jgi:Neuraminidase (sialidase)